MVSFQTYERPSKRSPRHGKKYGKLLALPQEILNQIWEYVAAGLTVKYYHVPEDDELDTYHYYRTKLIPALLLISKTQREATRKALIRSGTIRVRDDDEMCDLLCHCSDIADLTSLSIRSGAGREWSSNGYPLPMINDLFLRAVRLSSLAIELDIAMEVHRESRPDPLTTMFDPMRSKFLQGLLPRALCNRDFLHTGSIESVPQSTYVWLGDILDGRAFTRGNRPHISLTATVRQSGCRSERLPEPSEMSFAYDFTTRTMRGTYGTRTFEAVQVFRTFYNEEYRGGVDALCDSVGTACNQHAILERYIRRRLTNRERIRLWWWLTHHVNDYPAAEDEDIALQEMWSYVTHADSESPRDKMNLDDCCRLFFALAAEQTPLYKIDSYESALKFLESMDWEDFEIGMAEKDYLAAICCGHLLDEGMNPMKRASIIVRCVKGEMCVDEWRDVYDALYKTSGRQPQAGYASG